MFLKSLYISGFKSFAYPTTIDFSEDVSAIVGPNGSGKSNISDAIRFVLGEQRTKQMRSQSMEDIIFSGTDAQSPRGLAEVKLTLENDDQSDLVIERKYYRTGESDYLLNGKKVRLKDIHSQFADTGLGKNGYSIISQGGVENIIGASPKELRELVEEAVGIAGYKVRKNETVKRLNSIESNIERVLDVLTEMEKQLKPLKKQAKKAREYLEITNVLRDIDLVSFYEEEIEYKGKLEKLNKELVASNFTLMDLEKESEETDKNYVRVKNQLTETRELIENLNNEIILIRNDINRFEKQASVKNTDLKNYKENVIRLETELKTFNGNLESIDEKLKKLEKEKRDVSNNFNSVRNNVIKLSKVLRKKEDQRKLVESQNTESELEEINEQVSSLIIERIKLETEISSLGETQKATKERQENINKEISKLEDHKNQLQNKLNDLQQSGVLFMKQFNKANAKINEFEEKEQTLTTELIKVENKIDYQKQIRDSYEGFNYSVRTIMSYSKRNKIQGVYGPVGDLFTTDPKYQTAIQVALGAAVQNIVVENSKVAQELIEYLKKENKGRVTFLPLDNLSVSNTPFNDRANGLIDKASNLIEFKPKFQKVFEQLLGRTYIFSDYSSARNYRRTNRRNTLVTLEGECFYPSGAIVGGSLKRNFNQLLTPNLELNNLRQQEKKLNEEKKNILEQKNNFIQLIEKNTAKKNKLLKEEDNYKSELLSVNERLKLLTNEFSVISENTELKIKEDNLKKVNSDIKELENKRNIITENIGSKKDELSKLDEETTELKSSLVDKRIELNKYESSISHLNERLSEIRHSKEAETSKYNSKLEELEHYLQSTETNKNRIEELNRKTKSLKLQLENKETDLNKNREKFKQLDEYQAQIEEKVKNLNHTTILEMEAKNNVESQIERLTIKEENLASKIKDQYNENFESVSENIEQFKANRLDLDESEIYEYKQRLKKLGNVNPNSIEDYHELKTRYNSLSENYQDLIQSKEDVENTIDSLSQSMSKQFNDKFELLNDYFNKAFRTLFEGGKANLNLTNRENVLDSGIELFAQPPGKKLKHINLLSGGEKAMTSIALLFAFIELNPSPFIIIDEIDAALDESNINRFTNYLKKIQEQNQFIIITHRKSTLSECNNIHGVSMASDGISRLCSIKLSDYIGE